MPTDSAGRFLLRLMNSWKKAIGNNESETGRSRIAVATWPNWTAAAH